MVLTTNNRRHIIRCIISAYATPSEKRVHRNITSILFLHQCDIEENNGGKRPQAFFQGRLAGQNDLSHYNMFTAEYPGHAELPADPRFFPPRFYRPAPYNRYVALQVNSGFPKQ